MCAEDFAQTHEGSMIVAVSLYEPCWTVFSGVAVSFCEPCWTVFSGVPEHSGSYNSFSSSSSMYKGRDRIEISSLGSLSLPNGWL